MNEIVKKLIIMVYTKDSELQNYIKDLYASASPELTVELDRIYDLVVNGDEDPVITLVGLIK